MNNIPLNSPVLCSVALNLVIAGFSLRNIPAYIKGETAWSYLSRLAYANAVDNTDTFLSRFYGKENVSVMPYDAVLPGLYDAVQADGINSWNYESSVFQYLSPFTPAESHDARIRSYYRWPESHRNIIGSVKPQITVLKSCPECRRRDEESGNFHYHTEHQIPGLTLCPEHGCRLEYFSGRHGYEYSRREFTTVEERKDEETYTAFCRDLIAEPLTTSFNETKAVIKAKLAQKFPSSSFVWNRENKVVGDFFKENGISSSVFNVISSSGVQYKIPTADLITLLVCLYGSDAEAFKRDSLEARSEKVKDEEFIERLEGAGYTVEGGYNPLFLRLSFRGEHFVTTKHSMLSGWTTPALDADTDVQVLFRRLFYAAGDVRNLSLVSDFVRWGLPIAVKDAETQQKISVNAKEFIYYGVRSGTQPAEFSEEHIIDFFKKKPDFTLNKIQHKSVPYVSFTHSCGKSGYMTYTKFLSAPYCKDCRKDERKEKLEKEVKEITGGRFRLTEVSRSHYSAEDGEMTVTATGMQDLKVKLSSIVYKAEREIKAVTIRSLMEKTILNLIGVQGEKFFRVGDFSRYATPKDVAACLASLTAQGVLIQLTKDLFCRSDAVFQPKELCDRTCRTRKGKMIGIPVGESLIEEIGGCGNGNQQYAVNLASLVRTVKKTSHIGENTVTLYRLNTEFTDENWKLLSFLMTARENDLSSMVPGNRELLRSWCLESGIRQDSIMAQTNLFAGCTLQKAAGFIGD